MLPERYYAEIENGNGYVQDQIWTDSLAEAAEWVKNLLHTEYPADHVGVIRTTLRLYTSTVSWR